jgi:hypothetical protein
MLHQSVGMRPTEINAVKEKEYERETVRRYGSRRSC